MARPRAHLRNAPIVEAVIDFRVVRSESCTPDTFAHLESSIGVRYTQKFPVRLIQGGFGVDKGELLPTAASQMDIGWRYQAKTELAQFRIDGFTFSKVEPYTTWEHVFGEAFRLWNLYVKLACPRQISRIAVKIYQSDAIDGRHGIGTIPGSTASLAGTNAASPSRIPNQTSRRGREARCFSRDRTSARTCGGSRCNLSAVGYRRISCSKYAS